MRSWLLLPLVLMACADDEITDTDTDTDTDTEVAGTVDVDIAFEARFGEEDIACDGTYTPSTGSSTLTITDFRVYVSSPALIDADGNEVPITLTPDDTWQSSTVALLDFEDGTGGCGQTGNAPTNTRLVGTVPAGDYTALAFDIGVPPDENHQDTTAAAAPLNLSSMFWNWRGGYKFIRIDLKNDKEAPGNAWNVHLGSTGCPGEAATAPPTEPCAKPNRPRITVDLDPASDTVVFDLEGLIDGVDVGFNTESSPPGCMSGDAKECGELFPNLGLSFETGTCEDDCSGQTFVTVD